MSTAKKSPESDRSTASLYRGFHELKKEFPDLVLKEGDPSEVRVMMGFPHPKESQPDPTENFVKDEEVSFARHHKQKGF